MAHGPFIYDRVKFKVIEFHYFASLFWSYETPDTSPEWSGDVTWLCHCWVLCSILIAALLFSWSISGFDLVLCLAPKVAHLMCHVLFCSLLVIKLTFVYLNKHPLLL